MTPSASRRARSRRRRRRDEQSPRTIFYDDPTNGSTGVPGRNRRESLCCIRYLKVALAHLEVVLSHLEVALGHLEFDSDCRHSIRVSTYGVKS
jgi:hypothetical protein